MRVNDPVPTPTSPIAISGSVALTRESTLFRPAIDPLQFRALGRLSQLSMLHSIFLEHPEPASCVLQIIGLLPEATLRVLYAELVVRFCRDRLFRSVPLRGPGAALLAFCLEQFPMIFYRAREPLLLPCAEFEQMGFLHFMLFAVLPRLDRHQAVKFTSCLRCHFPHISALADQCDPSQRNTYRRIAQFFELHILPDNHLSQPSSTPSPSCHKVSTHQ